jgi:hypothetical protein
MTPPEPELAALLAMAVAFTMAYAGVTKHALELKRRRRTCPSCGRHISGAVCREH